MTGAVLGRRCWATEPDKGRHMTWLRSDDNYPNHPKVKGLSDKAYRLADHARHYCARNLTDGALDTRDVKVLLAESGATKKHVEELHHAGLWDRAGGGYLVHDFLDYNPSRYAVLELRDKRAEAGRKGGQNSGNSRNTEANAQANASKQNGKPRGSTPSRPVKESKTLGDEAWFERQLHKQNQR